MITVRISGGLGNQLFQYAFGRAKALEYGAKLVLVPDFSRERAERKLEIDSFDIQADIKASNDLGPKRIRWYIDRFLPIKKRKIVLEPTNLFSPAVARLGDGRFYVGNWQSEAYFKKFETEIRKDLVLKDPLSEAAQKIAEKIEEIHSVSIHVRRGDYAADQRTNEKHGLCSPEYYAGAIELIRSRIEDPVFFVFSDDIEWAKRNIAIGEKACFVSGRGISNAEELTLMSMCKHNIIANSTFSWWGAWLNQNPGKIVIAPKQWFQAILDTRDLIPKEWTLL